MNNTSATIVLQLLLSTYSGPFHAREPVIDRMEKREESLDKLGRLDSLVQTFRIPQRSFDEIHDDIVVPFGMIASQQNLPTG